MQFTEFGHMMPNASWLKETPVNIICRPSPMYKVCNCSASKWGQGQVEFERSRITWIVFGKCLLESYERMVCKFKVITGNNMLGLFVFSSDHKYSMRCLIYFHYQVFSIGSTICMNIEWVSLMRHLSTSAHPVVQHCPPAPPATLPMTSSRSCSCVSVS